MARAQGKQDLLAVEDLPPREGWPSNATLFLKETVSSAMW